MGLEKIYLVVRFPNSQSIVVRPKDETGRRLNSHATSLEVVSCPALSLTIRRSPPRRWNKLGRLRGRRMRLQCRSNEPN
jgi:hypothetical protein